MLERLRMTLVNSFIGAIGLGWLFAQGILHFAYMFGAPVAGWLARREYKGMVGCGAVSTGFSLQDALPELVRSVSLLLDGYFLLRWLYYKSIDPEKGHPGDE